MKPLGGDTESAAVIGGDDDDDDDEADVDDGEETASKQGHGTNKCDHNTDRLQ